jgi:hypothetical protein
MGAQEKKDVIPKKWCTRVSGNHNGQHVIVRAQNVGHRQPNLDSFSSQVGDKSESLEQCPSIRNSPYSQPCFVDMIDTLQA